MDLDIFNLPAIASSFLTGTLMTDFFDGIKKLLFNEVGAFSFIGKLIVALLIAFIAFVLVKLIDKLIIQKLVNNKIIKYEDSRIRTAASVVNSFVKIFIYAFAVLIILDFFGINTGSIIAVAGIGGLTVAFASQSIVRDVINGAFILFENQYDIGDWVMIQGLQGTVVDMSLRLVKIKDVAGQIHIIPNGVINIVTNYSKGQMKSVVDLSIPNNFPLEDLEIIVDEIAKKIKIENDLFLTKPTLLGIMSMQSFTYTARITALTNPDDQWLGERIIRKELLKRLQDLGVYTSIDRKKGIKDDGKI